MTATDARERPLREVVEVLQDYHDDLILIGGWVPYLQLTYGRARVADVKTSFTVEADLLVPRELEQGGRRPITETLIAAGFEMVGESGAVWARAADEGGATIEFMTPTAANFHADAAAILVERDGTEMAKAKADVAGHLEDIAEIIRRIAPE